MVAVDCRWKLLIDEPFAEYNVSHARYWVLSPAAGALLYNAAGYPLPYLVGGALHVLSYALLWFTVPPPHTASSALG